MHWDTIEKAIEVTAFAHEKQYRKGSDVPYIVHPYSVGMMLMHYGYPSHIIVASLLHDTVEDTDLTFADIQSQFGKSIADLVRAVSEENKQAPWEKRKQETLEKLEAASRDACLIICADKLHNIRAIRKALEEKGESVWNHFNRGRHKQAWYYHSIVEKLAKQLKMNQCF